MPRERFSQRRGHSIGSAQIRIRDDAPQEVRDALLQIAIDVGLRPSEIRRIVCRVLRVAPDQGNWSEYPNVWNEVQDLVSFADWYRVYDVVEAIHDYAVTSRSEITDAFEREVNQSFAELGVGWQLIDGQLEIRGPEHFEAALDAVGSELKRQDRSTAQREFHEALLDLSRRPDPDITGAVQHAIAGLECVARDVVGDPSATLGEILKKYPGRFPKPLDTAIEKLWGYASERARHVREGQAASLAEAELIVTVAAAAAAYVLRQQRE